MDLTLASPTCSTCRGSGWDSAHDRVCRCVRRADAAGVELDASPDWLTEEERDDLESSIRRVLIDARNPSAGANAAGIARIVARGREAPAMAPGPVALASYAGVPEDVAERISGRILLAIQTKKKGSR